MGRRLERLSHEAGCRPARQRDFLVDVNLLDLAEPETSSFRCVIRASIRETEQSRLLERLFRASTATEQAINGTGLSGKESALVPLSRHHLAAKRVLDAFVLTALLPAVLALAALVALLVKLDSPGPVLYEQVRVGRGGRLFRIRKFRSMIDAAEAGTGPVMTRPDDPRLTRVGRCLKRFHLDEIPQVWNVLRGEMSLVGPRPERPVFVSRFACEIPQYDDRHLVPPGLTGIAQLRGNYTSSPEHKLRFDLHYVSNRSIIRDLYLIVCTPFVVVVRSTASRASSKTLSGELPFTAQENRLPG
jgi:lipopolysaccharide/colanic/teichoic acid biosynthesis glycosyltransferase